VTAATRRVALTAAVIGSTAAIVWEGTYGAFTATTKNSGNSVTAGTVIINQHTGASTMFNVTNTKPGDSFQKCVRVISLFNLTVERGSGMTTLDSTDSCAGFTPSSTAFAAANIGTFPTSYAAGVDGQAAAATWATNDSIDYRFTISTNDDPTANAHTTTGTGTFSFTWEARS
jgi:hypothetical protein